MPLQRRLQEANKIRTREDQPRLRSVRHRVQASEGPEQSLDREVSRFENQENQKAIWHGEALGILIHRQLHQERGQSQKAQAPKDWDQQQQEGQLLDQKVAETRIEERERSLRQELAPELRSNEG